MADINLTSTLAVAHAGVHTSGTIALTECFDVSDAAHDLAPGTMGWRD
jgi:hypothetical protein